MPTIVCAKGETDDTVTQCCVKKVLMLGNGSIYLRQTTKKNKEYADRISKKSNIHTRDRLAES
jgi:hypothetical protein